MKADREKLIGIIVLIVITIAMIPLMCFALGSGESEGKSWKVLPRKNGESYFGESVILKVDGKVDSIYVKIGNVYNDNGKSGIDFTLDGSNSSKDLEDTSSYISIYRKQLPLKFEKDGAYLPKWYKIGEKLSISTKYLRLTTRQSFDFCEVAFLNKDGKVVKAEVYGGFEWKNNSRSFVPAKDDVNVTFSAVADGQNAFYPDRMHILSDKEASLAGAAQNLINGTAYYVSDSASPLSIAFYALGILIFGNTPFAVRLISLIFSIACFYAVYFLARKLFGGRLGIWSIVFWLLSGIGISFAGFATATSAGLFFAILALIFAYEFFTATANGKAVTSYLKPLILTGAFQSIAFLTDFYSIAILPATLILSIASVIRNVRKLKSEYTENQGLKKEYARESYVAVLSKSTVTLVVAYLIMPVLFLLIGYGAGYPLYSSYYGDKGIFGVAFANIADILSVNNFSLGFIIGIGSTKYEGITPISFMANKALTVTALIILVITVCLTAFAKCKKLKNADLSVALILNFEKTLFLSVTFAVSLLFVMILGGDYSVLCYALVPLILARPLALNVYDGNANRAVYGVMLSLGIVIAAVFFLLSMPVFLKIDLPAKIAKYIYGWIL